MPYKRGLGRSPRVLTIRVSEDIYLWLAEKAEESGDSVASVVRKIIKENMKQDKR